MSLITYRKNKGFALTHAELDKNLQVLADRVRVDRADLVLAVAEGTALFEPGDVVFAGGLKYQYVANGVDVLPNLPGFVPAGDARGGHFGCSPTEPNNSDQLQKAFDWSSATGEWVTLDAGSYTLLTTVIPRDRMRIRGVGMDKTILLQALTNFGSMISVGLSNTVKYVHMSDMTLNGQSFSRLVIGSAGHCFAAYNFERIIFERVKFREGLGYGIGAQGHPAGGTGKTGPMEELILDECILEYNGHGKFRKVSLTTSITDSGTSITVSDGTQLDQSGGTLMICTDESQGLGEIVKHGIVTGNTAPIVRGICGTTAQAWSSGAVVYRLSNGDGFDSKSGFRFDFRGSIARFNGDNGFNLRCNKGTISGCYAYKNGGPGIGLNANTSEDQYDIRTTLNGAVLTERTSTISVAVLISDTTINVNDTSSFPTSGEGWCESEQLSWTGKTATTLTGVTRGINSTTASAHAIGKKIAVFDSFVLTDASAFPTSGIGRVGSETFTWSGKSSNTLTGIYRGVQGTYAVAHDDLSTVSLDPNNNDADSIINIIGCHTYDNTSAGISVASGSSSSKAQINIIGHTSYNNGGGLNLSGGGMGTIGVNVSGGTFSENLTYGITISNCETLTITGVTIEANVDGGIKVVDQTNGGVIAGCDIRNNGTATAGYAIYEAGVTNHMRYLGGIIKDNGNKIRFVGDDSVAKDIVGYLNEYSAVTDPIPVDSIGYKTGSIKLAMDAFDLDKCSVDALIKVGTDYNDYEFKTDLKLLSGSVTTLNYGIFVKVASATGGATVKFKLTARG